MNLEFNIASCVRSSSKFSSCVKCIDICPTKTIELIDNSIAFTPKDCIDCGGCVGVCPTEAFSLSNISLVDFFFNFLESSDEVLECKSSLDSCLSILGVEYLISLGLSKANLKVNINSCNCDEHGKLKKRLKENIDEANFVLSNISNREIEIISKEKKEDEPTKEALNRRSLFSLKEIAKSKEQFIKEVEANELKEFKIDEKTIQNIRQKSIPDRRKLLFTILKNSPKPKEYHFLDSNDISFISQKYIEQSCTNCQICYRVCPTGALSSDNKFSVINFNAISCVKCYLCHDVCEPDSIKLQRGFNTKELFEPEIKTLISFDIRRCTECGNYFTYRGVDECPRCQIEEEEALMLHQNAKKFLS